MEWKKKKREIGELTIKRTATLQSNDITVWCIVRRPVTYGEGRRANNDDNSADKE